jgi:hypothetical protein
MGSDDESAQSEMHSDEQADSPSARVDARISGLEPEDPVLAPGEQTAQALFLSKYSKERKNLNKSGQRFLKTGSGPPTVTIIGLVLSETTVNVRGAKVNQLVPKKQCAIEVIEVKGNHANDLLASGVRGVDYLLPSYKPKGDGGGRDASDEAPESRAAKDKGRVEGPPRQLCFDDTAHKTCWIGSIPRCSFYVQAPGDQGLENEGMSLITPGMLVEVTGVVANLTESRDQVWLNTGSITPLLDGVKPGNSAKQIMEVLSRKEMMAAHAFRLSQAVGGFHGADYRNKPDCQMQANYFTEQWARARDGMAAACEARAMAIRGGNTGGGGEVPNALVLEEHAQRLRQTDPANLALGTPFFVPDREITPDRPGWTAGIIMKPVSCQLPVHTKLWDLVSGDPGAAEALPETFVAGEVNAVDKQGMCLNVSVKLTFVGSRTAACQAIKRGVVPMLSSGEGHDSGALGIKLNMRDLPLTTGLLLEKKADAFCAQLAEFGEWYAIAGVTPRPHNSRGVTCVFPTAWGFDMVPSIYKLTAAVSEEWVKEHLALGEGQFAWEAESESWASYLKDKDKKTPLTVKLPSIKENYYQEITGSTWKFANAKMPADAPKKVYRIWYDGICDKLNDQPDLGINVRDGEAHIAEVASHMSQSGNAMNINAFLHQHAALYVIATQDSDTLGA